MLETRGSDFQEVHQGLLLSEVIAIVVVIGVVLANLIADLLSAAVNPRIRYKVGDSFRHERRTDRRPGFEFEGPKIQEGCSNPNPWE